MMNESKGSLAAKLAEIGKAIGFGVPKDGYNQGQKYNYTSAAAVKMRVGPELAARGIAVTVKAEVLDHGDSTSGKGTVSQRVLVRLTLTFVDGATGEVLETQGLGSGMDSGDKAAMKAFTAAEKYAYVGAFCLAMGEDPERDEKDEEASGPSAQEELTRVTTIEELNAWARAHWDRIKEDSDLAGQAWPKVKAVADRVGVQDPKVWSKMRAYAHQKEEA
jgi:hypothetical protein